jgi:hypothetical protein
MNHLGESRPGPLESDAGQAMQTHPLDQLEDLRLRVAETQGAPARPEAPGDHCEVEHHRRVGEHELGEVDDDIALGCDGTDESLAAGALGGPVLVSSAAKNRRLVIEVDDRANLAKRGGS